jgi:hypothetical protein
MNELKLLQSLGFTLPSPAYLLGSIVFGVVGCIALRRGRKTTDKTLTWLGVGLMLYPYAISQTWLLWSVGLALCAWVYAQWR